MLRWGRWLCWAPRRLLTFKLDGKAKLPPTTPYDTAVYPLDDPSLPLDPAAVAAGDTLYHNARHGCHGKDAQSSGAPEPDLRKSAIALDREALWYSPSPAGECGVTPDGKSGRRTAGALVWPGTTGVALR